MYFMQLLEISWDFGILGFSNSSFLGYEDFQSNLPLGIVKRLFFLFFSSLI